MITWKITGSAPLLALVVLIAATAPAENIDLSTVPNRDSMQLTIYNSEDLTLVRETRKVSFKPGANPLEFSWANTLIDPTSVQLRFLTHTEKLTLLDTTFPHARPQVLYWNVQSELDGEALAEITYFTSGIHWSADYIGIAQADEALMNVEGFVKIDNQSGEEYEDAQLRLVVGRVNLVQKIAHLAQALGKDMDLLAEGEKHDMKLRVVRDLSDLDKDAKGSLLTLSGVIGGQQMQQAPKQIAKEGLGEYFIYTIEGTETIPSGWSKRLRSLEAAQVPVKIQYRYRPAEYGDRLVRMYLLANNKESKLGTTPLPDGTFHLFRQNGHDGLSFLAGQAIKYIPIGDKIELNLGVDPEVIFELVKLRSWRDAIWMNVRGTNLFERVDQPGVKIRVNSFVAGWDEHAWFAQRLRNYTKKAIDVEVRRTFPGDVIFRSGLPAKNHDYRTVEYTAAVAAGAKAELQYEVVTHQGHNARQNRVVLETAPFGVR